MLGVKYTMPQMYVPHRWLSIYDVTVYTLRLWDALTLFYYGFLKKEDRCQYISRITEIMRRKDSGTNEQRAPLCAIWDKLSQKKLTSDGAAHKEKVLNGLYFNRKEHMATMHLYATMLPQLKSYVLLFEAKKPSVHKLHDEQVRLLTSFLVFFVKPQCIPAKSTELAAKEFSKDDFLADSDIFLGPATRKVLMECKPDFIKDFLKRVKQAYVDTGRYLQKKMPVSNVTLKYISAVDPAARGHSLTLRYMLKLPGLVLNVLKEDQLAAFQLEARNFQVESKLPPYAEGQRVDEWWGQVAATNNFNHLARVCLALLTCFDGPQVESTFSVMSQILDPQSARLNITSLHAIQTVK